MSDQSSAVQMAAVILLHKEIMEHGEVRLQGTDFDMLDIQQEVVFGQDPQTGEYFFRHNKTDKSEPLN